MQNNFNDLKKKQEKLKFEIYVEKSRSIEIRIIISTLSHSIIQNIIYFFNIRWIAQCNRCCQFNGKICTELLLAKCG